MGTAPTTDGGAVPAADIRLMQERRQGRHAQHYEWWPTVLTAIHTSWLRRDRWWLVFPILLAVALRPH